MSAAQDASERRDCWERRLIQKHGFPPFLARVYAELRNGKPD
ncbi:hypothetical protein [Marinovum sp.]|nr:hypothetical protein [Marinovum sp.]